MMNPRQLPHTAAEFSDTSPLTAAITAFIGGLALGLALPSTRRENQLVGETSERVKDMGLDAYRRARHVAKRTVNEAMAEARRQGMTPEGAKEGAMNLVNQARETLGDATQEVVETARETLKETAREEFDEAKDQFRNS